MSVPHSVLLFGRTALGLPILAHRWQSGPGEVLILGGVHGDESEGVACASGLIAHFLTHGMPYGFSLTLIPAFNLDGVLARSRLNGNGVDLNRNLPSNDWNPQAFNERYPPGKYANSEPENQALTRWLEAHRPGLIISLHSWNPMINVNGSCLPEAQALHAETGYEIVETIGYPTPGSLGTYAGMERDMPTITYEIERGQALSEVVRVHVPACLKALEVAQERWK